MKFNRKNKTNKYLKIKINNSDYKNRNTKNKQYLKFILIFISFFAFAFLIYKLFIKKILQLLLLNQKKKFILINKMSINTIQLKKHYLNLVVQICGTIKENF